MTNGTIREKTACVASAKVLPLKALWRYTSARRLSTHVGDTRLESCTHIVIVGTLAVRAIRRRPTSTTTCNLEDGRQVYMRYNAVSAKQEKPANGKPWAPGGTPMTLFTEAQLSLGSSMIPIGAYAVYPIPAKDNWTLVVNKNVTPGRGLRSEARHCARADGNGTSGSGIGRTGSCVCPCRRALHVADLHGQERFVRRLHGEVKTLEVRREAFSPVPSGGRVFRRDRVVPCSRSGAIAAFGFDSRAPSPITIAISFG